MLGFLVPNGFGLGVVPIALVDGQHPFDGQINVFFIQQPCTHGFHNAPVVCATGGRHFQIQTCMHALHAVAHSAQSLIT